jgi:hypothetical protein
MSVKARTQRAEDDIAASRSSDPIPLVPRNREQRRMVDVTEMVAELPGGDVAVS